MNQDDVNRLGQTIQWMERTARDYGLDFFDMRYEICPADVVYTIAGFGMPTRYSHWSFGKQYYRQKLDFDLGLSRIYELVVNNDPCYAFFLDSNTVMQNEMIVAHVLGHSDFFKNNARFRYTNRHMIDTMAATAERFRSYEQKYGLDRVEAVIDAAMSIQEHVDPSWRARAHDPTKGQVHTPLDGHSGDRKDRAGTSLPYHDLWSITGKSYPLQNHSDDGQTASGPGLGHGLSAASAEAMGSSNDALSRTGPSKEQYDKDLLRFVVEHGRHLEDWEIDILASVRQEMLYFWPQLETKIMNEGWASYWHTKLMHDMDLNEQDALEFAKLTANVTQPNRYSLNPYQLGLAMWRDIEQRYGTERMFEIRECDSDVSFIRNYLTQDLVDECQLYIYAKRGSDWVVVERSVDKIRELLIRQRINGGFPTLLVDVKQSEKTGDLTLVHSFEGQELDVKYIERTLPRVERLWGEPVRLVTVLDGQEVEFVCSEQGRVQRKAPSATMGLRAVENGG
ncbi:SpoVR family protein [Alicyclobacillus tolerans]|uniref:SpoVR family protein n=1 Tax=Alicyclobacillus tolerans TaxID=90970 RepID=UPI002351723D|nr:SpoVR family protein [Alicyclobacillus tolerans]MCF8566446.1 SpoVR family protein [Alicyclobacillus tolerans]